jgi:hypothetical protein
MFTSGSQSQFFQQHVNAQTRTWGSVLAQLYLHHEAHEHEQPSALRRIRREDLVGNHNRQSQPTSLLTSQCDLHQSDTRELPIEHQEPTGRSHFARRLEEFQALHSLQYEWLEMSFSQDAHHDVVLAQELLNSLHLTIALWNESDALQ